MFKRKGGGGGKGLLNNVKKTALFLRDGFPNRELNIQCIGQRSVFSFKPLFEEKGFWSIFHDSDNTKFNWYLLKRWQMWFEERNIIVSDVCEPPDSLPSYELGFD